MCRRAVVLHTSRSAEHAAGRAPSERARGSTAGRRKAEPLTRSADRRLARFACMRCPGRARNICKIWVSERRKIPTLPRGQALRFVPHRRASRRLSTLADGPIPMSIADRVEAEAVRRGTLSQLPGRGKPLPEKEEREVAIGKLSQNMEARARRRCAATTVRAS